MRRETGSLSLGEHLPKSLVNLRVVKLESDAGAGPPASR
jgi:hypothetical protein